MNRQEAIRQRAELDAIINRKPVAGEVWINRRYTKDNLRLIVVAEDGSVFAVSPTTGKYKGKGVTFDQYEFVKSAVTV